MQDSGVARWVVARWVVAVARWVVAGSFITDFPLSNLETVSTKVGKHMT